MTHDVIRHLLDDYVTGDLSEDARDSVADHVAACAICSAEVEDLKRVITRASELPKSIDPPTDAWTNIRAAIDRDRAAAATESVVSRKSQWRRPAMLAAAAAIVAAIMSSALTSLYLNSRSHDSSQTASRGDSAGSVTLASFTIEENNYLRTAAALQDVLDQQETSLAPETVVQLKASLRTIDEAILEARNALARDPSNKLLVEMLSANYRQKVDLLRRSTEITRGT
ncbi:MAG: anti-sigma factor family protein [Gemmatimonadaceae bacterium]|jgi:anti-sigma-K factor RskA